MYLLLYLLFTVCILCEQGISLHPGVNNNKPISSNQLLTVFINSLQVVPTHSLETQTGV